MMEVLNVGGLCAEVARKAIKHVHLSVLPPEGKVRVAAPLGMGTETIRLFLISKLAWIRRQQGKLRGQEREAPREFMNKESHYLWGKRYLLEIQRVESAPSVEIKPRKLILKVRRTADPLRCAASLDAWYRQQVRLTASDFIASWQPRLGVKANRLFVQHMKTKWGGCAPATGNIRLNTELAKKPRECLEYIVVHELLHLLEPTHNERFMVLMDRHLPQWRQFRAVLNRLPVRHETWAY
ncbi:MAG: M48 family metallopeptidase [Burkholderiales bacterium]|nr:M48 family metallopeptidase [Burkholderiales bacterium]